MYPNIATRYKSVGNMIKTLEYWDTLVGGKLGEMNFSLSPKAPIVKTTSTNLFCLSNGNMKY